MKNKIVILTGAGISAESGISTFRDSDGLWENHRIEDVATFAGWKKNRKLVLDFYNERRRLLPTVKPNDGHLELVRLEEKYDVTIITQNVDDLHERAGSSNIIHLHGELTKAQSTVDSSIVVDIGYNDILEGDKCVKGSQLRPFIVWFGEAVPNLTKAIEETKKADIFIVIGTSLQVYPAASLIDYVPLSENNIDYNPTYLIDPNHVSTYSYVNVIKENASTGVKKLVDKLMEE
jgi:NAD-dependent deacetylase